MRNESGFWSCIYHLFILSRFVEFVFSKTINMVLVILLSLMLSKICYWVAVYECAAVMCLSLFSSFFFIIFQNLKLWTTTFSYSLCLFYSRPVYQSHFPYIHLCGLIVLVIGCNFIYSFNFHPDSCVFKVVCYNRTCKETTVYFSLR